MNKKSITKSRHPSRNKSCPREDLPVRGNSPDWYTRENLPYKGENFNVLSSIAPQPGVMFEEGVSTNTGVFHQTIIHPPVDSHDSFYRKAADFYAEIREKNSGAANYNVDYLAAYMYDVGVLHALAHTVARAIKAVRSVMPSSADSPYILSRLAGVQIYDEAAAQLAVFSNRYTILAKDIENLPLPHVTAFDRSRFLYSSLFADSNNPKPALLSFVPFIVIELRIDDSGNLTNRVVNLYSDPSVDYIETLFNVMDELLEYITTNYIFTIIRGDIRNAFGSSAYWEGLVSLLASPLNLIPEDPETMSQLENLSMIPRDSNGASNVTYEYSESDGQYVLRCEVDGINDSPSLSRIWLDNNLVNYHGSDITDGELLAITRMMFVGYKDNRLTKTDAVITASSGNTVYVSFMLTNVSKDDSDQVLLSELLMDAQVSTVQSTMKAAFNTLTFTASNVAHFPMLIWGSGPREYMWSVDNYAIVSNVNLVNMTIIANRSLWDVHLPRGEHGRLEKRA